MPLVPLPAEMLTKPPLPPVAVPLPMRIAPELPPFALPELKTSRPLEPETPAFAVTKIIAPLDACVPSPLQITTLPPEAYVDRPAMRVIAPPLPLVPEPTAKLIPPPRPPVAAPVPIMIAPLLPSFELPELKKSLPVEPAAPAFAVFTMMTPLDVAVPSPDFKHIRPPVATVPFPEPNDK